MNLEMLKIFDEQRNEIGVATREEVHRLGHWHEAFHCWFLSKENSKVYIYLQNRSKTKKDYPDLLDITAAGHLLAHESVLDGVREIKEEVGIDVSFDELIPLGIIKYDVSKGNFIDREFAHVYVHISNLTINDFHVDGVEVSGIVKVEFNDFVDLWLGKRSEVEIEGYELDSDGNRIPIHTVVSKSKFVQHEHSYYVDIINGIRQIERIE